MGDSLSEIRFAKSKVHFIGIGGIGMCGLAELLHNMGVYVQGSDMSENAQTQRLQELGIKVFKGHDATQVRDIDVVVYSSAIKRNNVEFTSALKQGVPLIPRAEALAEIMRLKRGVAVAGTHGKTTTTSMSASVFIHAHLDPTVVVGGRLDLIKSTAQLGEGEWLIAEADESDGSFNRLSPEVVIITNIDNDHMDHYLTFENLQNAFFEFASRIPFYGSLIYCGDEDKAYELFEGFPKKSVSYGFEERNDYQLKNTGSSYKVFREGQELGEFRLNVAGDHNALNAMAAILSGIMAGVPFAECVKGVEAFEGVDRRFQFKGEVGGVRVYDDYGHHPTEVKAVLKAFKQKYPNNRLITIFQPHRFSRTRDCWQDFLSCFTHTDVLKVVDIYPAGEKPIVGVDANTLTRELDHGCKEYVATLEELKQKLQTELVNGDVLLTLGAGHIWRFGEEMLEDLK